MMERYITDERTGLKYELVGDYYLIAGEDEPEGRPIGIWGQRHLRYTRKHKVSEQTLYGWRKKFGEMEPTDIKRLRELEAENAKLKRMVAEREMAIDTLKEINRKKW